MLSDHVYGSVLFGLVTIILDTSNKSCPKSSHTFRYTTVGGSATHSAVYPTQSRPPTPSALSAKVRIFRALLNPHLGLLNIWAPSLASGHLSPSSNHLPSALLSLCGISPAIPSFHLALFSPGWCPSTFIALCGISPAILPSFLHCFRLAGAILPSSPSVASLRPFLPSVWHCFRLAGALLPSSPSVASLRPSFLPSCIVFAWLVPFYLHRPLWHLSGHPSFLLALFSPGWCPSTFIALCGISPAIPSFRLALFSPGWCPSTFIALCGISPAILPSFLHCFRLAGALLPSSPSVASLRPFLPSVWHCFRLAGALLPSSPSVASLRPFLPSVWHCFRPAGACLYL
ncbi:uncharacterized protein HD556DRAFT_1484684 [Suillus plorans]|uniref:Uncharacterized protein n=1 Tax=Suillus plorans TaxID=116603 RepID=A0A9P7DGE6_9AGAM|nr:uncharacterized protein HD556DRAFT_1484684 [Suillus plorans]KAG1791816.1 hypothetical protein HD556DRAFT_1484684 [Suillus plorans]